MVVLADGLSSSRADAILRSRELKNAGVEIITVEVGLQVSHEELIYIASSTDRVLSITEPDALRSIIRYRGMAECAGKYIYTCTCRYWRIENHLFQIFARIVQ